MVASPRHPSHRISLQGAWEPPQDGLDAWARSFGRPAELPAGERIELVIVASRPVLESVMLNDRPVIWAELAVAGAGTVCGRCDVTENLERRNDLELRAIPSLIDAPNGRRGPLPDGVARVWLEIRGLVSVDHP